MSYRDKADFARETGTTLRLLRGLIRRMVVKLTDGARWQVLGMRDGTGGDETPEFEPFTGIGFYSRPRATSSPEAITAAVGDTKATVIAALRDEQLRQEVAGDLEEDETATFNSQSIVKHTASGTIEARSAGGVAESLSKNAEFTRLYGAIVAAIAALGGVAPELAALKTALDALNPAWPAGTTVLKGE